MNRLLYAAIAAYAVSLLALAVGYPAASRYALGPLAGVLLMAWYVMHRRQQVRDYRALKARRDAHARELEDFVAKQS